MTGYDLSRQWFDFAFENPDKVSGNHSALYWWAIELNNRLGWVNKFGMPTDVAMTACGIRSYKTYSKIFDDLVSWGFFDVYQRSKNQFTSNVIALVFFTEAMPKQYQSIDQSITNTVPTHCSGTVDIIKPLNLKTFKPLNLKTNKDADRVSVDQDPLLEEKNKPPSKVARKVSPAFDALNVDLPHADQFASTWAEWVSHRKQKKSPLTEVSVKKQLEFLSCYTEKVAIEIILTSITSGWQGLFEPKQNGKSNSNNSQPGPSGISPRLQSAWELLDQSRKSGESRAGST
jgi:hypothetical protein